MYLSSVILTISPLLPSPPTPPPPHTHTHSLPSMGKALKGHFGGGVPSRPLNLTLFKIKNMLCFKFAICVFSILHTENYINTNEVPGGLYLKKLIHSHYVKVTCYFTCEKITVAMAM